MTFMLEVADEKKQLRQIAAHLKGAQ